MGTVRIEISTEVERKRTERNSAITSRNWSGNEYIVHPIHKMKPYSAWPQKTLSVIFYSYNLFNNLRRNLILRILSILGEISIILFYVFYWFQSSILFLFINNWIVSYCIIQLMLYNYINSNLDGLKRNV